MSRRRGFMMVEAIVGGGLLSIAVVAVLHQVVQGDQVLSVSARRGLANAALWSQVNRYRATDYGSFPADGTVANQPVPGTSVQVLRYTTTVSTLGAADARCRLCKQVDIRVEYKNTHRQWLSLDATTYVPQP